MKNIVLNIILDILFIIHNSTWLQSAFYILIILLLSLPLFLSCFMLVKVVSCKKNTDDIITLEDDIKYNVVDKININNIEYLYLDEDNKFFEQIALDNIIKFNNLDLKTNYNNTFK